MEYIPGNREVFRTVSPIVSPLDPAEIVKNLQKKREAVEGKSSPLDLKVTFFEMKPVKVKWNDQFFVWGKTGHVLIEGNPDDVSFAADVGLGRKNAMGFGMLR